MPQYLLGYDLGSSSVKACLLEASSGKTVASAAEPAEEMEIVSRHPGWAEQDPQTWWQNLVAATQKVLATSRVPPSSIVALGISYQMHGLVVVDNHLRVLRPSIIWCDSRAVEIGDKAHRALGDNYVQEHLLNSPGNFTASKLKWVMENEPDVYARIFKVMLPGDYLAMRLTGEVTTTASGLSEGIMWDFKQQKLAITLFNQLGIDTNLVADTVATFSVQGQLTAEAAAELGLVAGTPLCYRAGDQPNNAFSLMALRPGDVAATAGTSGVVYAVTDKNLADSRSRVNSFLHVNHQPAQPRLGVLLCVNGAGIMNSWLRKSLLGEQLTYEVMDALAAEAPIGSEQLLVLPFGNGAERMLGNLDLGGSFHGLNPLRHRTAHLCRAVQEGVVFGLGYGLEILREIGVSPNVIRAGKANMFKSQVFCETFAQVAGVELEVFNVDGAQGAARGAGVGLGHYKNMDEAFQNVQIVQRYAPLHAANDEVKSAYSRWKEVLRKQMEIRQS
jgi:xylulokinase